MWTATGSTMGKSSPASVALDAGRIKAYRYRGNPDWIPGQDRDEDDGQQHRPNAKAIAGRANRIDKFCELLDGGKDRKEAEKFLGIGRSAGKDYHNEYLRRKQQGESDA